MAYFKKHRWMTASDISLRRHQSVSNDIIRIYWTIFKVEKS